ncbi:MAG: hypothetical protein ACKO14_02880 [Armatimonadota bacterium]
MRCINIVNFIRAIEPRFTTDLLLPVQKQMEIIKASGLPATWLLQYDALVSGPFVAYLKQNMPETHEVGLWFEMNEMHCYAADVAWRGRPGYEWDHIPHVAFTIGYTEAERIKLADTAMRTFKNVFGVYPKSIASWNLDSITVQHLSENYGVDAFAVCRDQIATDGFTIWGAPIAGYYPSKRSCWSPALTRQNQISTPIFRMLGQDPVYYYDKGYTQPDGKFITSPDTMEPVWPSGRSPHFVQTFLSMILDAPAQKFAYAQIGQENSFPWPSQQAAYAPQIKALAALHKKRKAVIETMGESGRSFKKSFHLTPTQAQVQLTDPFQNTNPEETSIWYQSRFYRANLHFKGDLPYLRDITVYSDEFEQPFLKQATRLEDVEQKMPPVLDGYHWRTAAHSRTEPGAGGFFIASGQRLMKTGIVTARESGNSMTVLIPVQDNKILQLQFDEKKVFVSLRDPSMGYDCPLTLSFEWDVRKANLTKVTSQRVAFRLDGFDYSVRISGAAAEQTPSGWMLSADGKFALELAQPR